MRSKYNPRSQTLQLPTIILHLKPWPASNLPPSHFPGLRSLLVPGSGMLWEFLAVQWLDSPLPLPQCRCSPLLGNQEIFKSGMAKEKGVTYS